MKKVTIAKKSVKKGIDKTRMVRYTSIIPCDTEDKILENDTESRRTRSRDFHESRQNKDSQFVKWVLKLEGNFEVRYRIKHESLILAQDERWRRA